MTQRKDSAYTNGVIAVREKKLLKEKLVKACSANEEEAMRLFFESGFGGGDFSLDAESAVLADERDTDGFIREYAPSREVSEYLLSPRDFHNAKAIVKARYLNCDESPFVGSEGNFSVAELKKAIETGDAEPLGAELGGAIEEARALLQGESPAGADVGFLFDRALFAYLLRVTKKHGVCRKLTVRKIDMTNLLTCFRAQSAEQAERFLIGGGSVSKEKLESVFCGTETVLKEFEKSDYKDFVKKLCKAKEEGEPYTEAEKTLESFETDYFAEKPYELSGEGNFLYYVFRRRAENENVRIVFVGLRAGLTEGEIKKRLRGGV